MLSLSLALCFAAQPAWGKDDRVDFSEVEVPLYEQIVNRMDVKGDLYGVVYAPEGGRGRVYNPFEKASAYRR